MPWKLQGKCVYKENKDGSLGELVKCHKNVEEAKAHLRALYANVEDSYHELSMFITKASIVDGEMRWAATNSDTSKDLYGERMSVELYKSMIDRINRKEPVPEPFSKLVTSSWWKGGMPYVSLAHYSDGDGRAVPGMPEKIYVDGKALKAKGKMFDTPLGRAVWKALEEDENNQNDDRIRISVGFLDLAHKHGEDGKIFERKSVTDICPLCKSGVGDKIYIDGYLVHLALTRVPVNPRTLMTVEKSMAKKTRKEDALSIVKEEALVEEVEKVTLETKSEVLIERADSDTESDAEVTQPIAVTPEVPETPDVEPVAEVVVTDACSSDKKDMEEEDEEEDEKEGVPATKKSLSSEDIQAIAEVVKSLLPQPVVVNTLEEVKVEKSALDISVEKLYNSVNQAMQTKNITIEERLASINPALQELGQAITEQVKKSVGVEAQTEPNDGGMVLEAITSLTNTVKELATEVATLKAQASQSLEQPRIPAPRAVTPMIQASMTTEKPVNPNSVANIVRRSVSSQLELK